MDISFGADNGTCLQSSVTKKRFYRNITSSIVELLEKDLDFYDKVSLCFLLCENENIEATYQTLKLGLKKLLRSEDLSTFLPLSDWARRRELGGDVKWQEKLVEALCIIKNHVVIEKLGYNVEEMNKLFLTHNPYVSSEVDVMRKALYFVIDSLTVDKAKKLIKLAVKDGKCKGYSLNTCSSNFLEISLLQWNLIKYINFTYGVKDVSNLSHHLKVLKEEWLSEFLQFIERRLNIHNSASSKSSSHNWSSSLNSEYSESSSEDHNSSCISGSLNFPHSKIYSYAQAGGTSDSYKMNPQNVGVCLIINQKVFHEDDSPDVEPLHPSQKFRMGTDIDRDRLTDIFEALGLNVECFSNLTSKEMLKTIHSVTRNSVMPDHTCFVLCILSHGKKDAVYGSNSVPVHVREIENLLNARNCRHLMGKPKILIIQACQGTPMQNMYEWDVVEDGLDSTRGSSRQCVVIPEISDEIIFWSTIPGYASFRDILRGTWFIKALTNELMLQKKGDEICKIFVKVNANVANRYTANRKAMQPTFSTSFTKLFYFTFSAPKKLHFMKCLMKRQIFHCLLKEFFLQKYRNLDPTTRLEIINRFCRKAHC